MRHYRRELLISFFLVVATLAVYAGVRGCHFVNFDDDEYVSDNPHLYLGLTGAGVSWALTTLRAGNWHPLTWLSLLLDYQLHGRNAVGYHLTNVLLHAANVVLLFGLLRGLTGAVWRSALAAALFAWHPLHVESVVWIAERKDVLSTFFALLTLMAYGWYAARPGWLRYAVVLGFFVLGLMAKPMLVTLPFVLLLLDYWPLCRLTFAICNLQFAILEKLPFFILSAASCVVTLYAQHQGGAVRSLEHLPLGWRLANALVAYVRYLELTFWPRGLAVFYPHPRDTVPLTAVVAASLLLVPLTTAFLSLSRGRSYLAVGWLWFLGTLVPVIGLVQVGGQALADRYTYWPHVGLFVLLAWALGDLVAWRPKLALGVLPGVGAALAACCVLTGSQVKTWHDGRTLWEHTLAVTAGNYVAHNNLGNIYGSFGYVDHAIEQYRAAVRINPDYADAHNNLGAVLLGQGKVDEAVSSLAAAVHLQPSSVTARHNYGLALMQAGRDKEALEQLREAVRLRPRFARARHNLGKVLFRLEHFGEAVEELQQAVQLQSGVAAFCYFLAAALYESGCMEEAAAQTAEAKRLDPSWPEAARHHAWQLATQPGSQRRAAEALSLARAARAAAGDRPEMLDTLAAAYAAAGRFDDAAATARQAVTLASAAGRSDLSQRIEARLRRYQDRRLAEGE